MLNIGTLVCCAPKMGFKKEDFEDAFSSPYTLDWSADKIRVAIADGATESSFSKEWANILVKKQVKEGLNILDEESRRVLGQEWAVETSRNELPWFATEKASLGAYAAYLGLTIDGNDGSWSSEAIGDCCLFVIHEGQVEVSFPLDKAGQFGNSPNLICSKETSNEGVADWLKSTTGVLRSGDLVIMATDAIAAWFVGSAANSEQPWRLFDELVDDNIRTREKLEFCTNLRVIREGWLKDRGADFSEDSCFERMLFGERGDEDLKRKWTCQNLVFCEWLGSMRNAGKIKNDDSTVMVLKVY